MKCDNCSNDAVYTHADPGINPAHYCAKCLPHWLHERANAGHFPLMEKVTERIDKIIEDTEAELKKAVKKKPAAKSTAVPTEEATISEDNN